MSFVRTATNFINVDIWKIPQGPGIKSKVYHWLKILIMAVKEVAKDQVPLKASALTYFSILSIVPVVAIVFGISKGFGFAIDIKAEMAKFFSGQEVVLNQTFIYAQNMLDNAKGGIIVGFGVLFLIYTVMRLLNNIEQVFNSIWSVESSRSVVRKFTDYLAIVIFGPILIVMSNGMTVYVTTQIRTITEKFAFLGYVEPLLLFALRFSPYVMIWLLFSLLYIIMPNTRVRIKSAIVAGIVAGTIFQLLQWGFINFQVGVAKYNAIYGSLAALPLFLIWTQLSWTVVFIGGEIAYAHQNVRHYIPANYDVHLSQKQNHRIALLVMERIVKNFEKGSIPLTREELADQLRISHRFLSDVLDHLIKAGVLYKSDIMQKTAPVYIPTIDINKVTIHYVFKKLDATGLNDIQVAEDTPFQSINKALDQLQSDIEKSKGNTLLKDL